MSLYESDLKYASECCHEVPTDDGDDYILDKCSSCRGHGCRDCKGSSLTDPIEGICSSCKQKSIFAYPAKVKKP